MAGSGEVGYLDKSVDLMVLVRPLSTVDEIIQKLPILRCVLGGGFLSVGATVTGGVDDPKVRISPARDVSQGLVDIFARTVRLPVHVFDPVSQAK